MAKRRGHGEGSVTLLKDGRWRAYISMEKGKRKYFYGKTQKEVIEKLQKGQREKHKGELIVTPDQPLETYLIRWLEWYKSTVRLATYNGRCYAVMGHIIPALGHIPLRRLTPQDVRAFYTNEMKAGIKPQTVRNYHVILHQALKQAIRDGLVTRNVCDLVDPPKPIKREMQILDSEQARRLLEAARGHKLEVLLILAVSTGMRQGELLALRWSDINLDKGVLSVRRTVKRVGRYGVVETEPKTTRGKRQISLPNVVVESLRVHYTKQQTLKQKAGDKWKNKGLVVCNRHGDVLHPTHMTYAFKELLDVAGLPDIRFHDLRHSAATLFLAMGVHPKVVQEILGHSNIAITMDTYSHVLPPMHQEAMRKMGDILTGE